MIAEIVLCWTLVAGSGARENEKGLEAWGKKDTAGAIRHLEKAARDTSDPRYGYNLGTVKAISGKPDADAAFERSLHGARSPDQKARILYNRGTSRLLSAKGGKGDPSGAVQDFREALKLKPGWQEASRNLELALRMQKQDQDRKKNKPKDQDNKQDQKKPQPQGGGQDKDKQDPQPPPPRSGMDPQDAQRLLDAAKAQEGKQLKRPSRKEESDGPDW
jgi:hypothetical protein